MKYFFIVYTWDLIILSGSRRTLLPDSRPSDPLDKSQLACLTVRVRSAGNIAALEKLAYQLSTRLLAQRRYLTREEFAEQYGAHTAALDLVEQLAQNHDLMVVYRDAAERSIGAQFMK